MPDIVFEIGDYYLTLSKKNLYQEKALQEDVQELINKYNKQVDDKVKEKETELMSV